jgi:hypothetical protein
VIYLRFGKINERHRIIAGTAGLVSFKSRLAGTLRHLIIQGLSGLRLGIVS